MVSLHCHVELERGPELDISLPVDVQWNTPILINNFAPSLSVGNYSSEILINSFRRSHSGIYTRMAVVTPISTFVNGNSGCASL